MDYTFVICLALFGAGLCLGYVLRAITDPVQPPRQLPGALARPIVPKPLAPRPAAPAAPDWEDPDWSGRIGGDEIERLNFAKDFSDNPVLTRTRPTH